MSNDTEFVNGLIVKPPRDGAPEYVKAKISIKREELIGWLNTKRDEWINVDVKVSQGGKWYAAVDNWKPQSATQRQDNRADSSQYQQPAPNDNFNDDDIPF